MAGCIYAYLRIACVRLCILCSSWCFTYMYTQKAVLCSSWCFTCIHRKQYCAAAGVLHVYIEISTVQQLVFYMYTQKAVLCSSWCVTCIHRKQFCAAAGVLHVYTESSTVQQLVYYMYTQKVVLCSSWCITCIHRKQYCAAELIIVQRELYVSENYGVWMIANDNAEFNRKRYDCSYVKLSENTLC